MGPFGPFLVVDTLRQLVTFAVLQQNIHVSSTAIISTSESLKLVVTVGMLVHLQVAVMPSQSSKNPGYASVMMRILLYAVPAALYFGNNLLYFTALQLTTPGRVQTAVSSRLPFTAALHHLVIVPQRQWRAWASLACLCAGLALTQYHPSHHLSAAAEELSRRRDLLGSAVGLSIGAISAVASVCNEKFLKDPTSPFWRSQFWLYAWGLFFAFAGTFVWDGAIPIQRAEQAPALPSAVALATIACGGLAATSGMLAGRVLRNLDVVWKLVGNALILVSVSVSTAVLYPDRPSAVLTPQFVAGAGIILIASWHYGYWSEIPTDHVPPTEQADVQGAASVRSSTPTTRRTMIAAFVTLLASLYASVHAASTNQHVVLDFGALIGASTVSSAKPTWKTQSLQ